MASRRGREHKKKMKRRNKPEEAEANSGLEERYNREREREREINSLAPPKPPKNPDITMLFEFLEKRVPSIRFDA